MLYKLLEGTPKWFYNAVVHGWVHPVAQSLQIHNSGTADAHIDLDLNADYRLRFRPHNSSGQLLTIEWETPPPLIVTGKRITRFAFDDVSQIPRLLIIMGPDQPMARVNAASGSLQLPIDWTVEESHEGLWRACMSRTYHGEMVSDTIPLPV